MGNAQSFDTDIDDTNYKIRPKIGSEEGGAMESIKVCLLCHRNSQDTALHRTSIAKVKNIIKDFLQDVYPTNPNTIFEYTTWDTEDADIVLSRDTHLRQQTNPIFDVVIELHCYDASFPAEDFRVMCRLLKPYGLFLVPQEVSSTRSMVAGRDGDFSCDAGATMVPIFSLPTKQPGPYAIKPMIIGFDQGLTVFQKL